MSECPKCGNTDVMFYYDSGDETRVCYGCQDCLAMWFDKVDLDVEVVLETDSDKIERIDQNVMEILCRLDDMNDEPKLGKEDE